MEKYRKYRLEDFLLDDEFCEWVRSGAVMADSFWAKLLSVYPEKKDDIERAVLLVREWKKLPSGLSDDEMLRDIKSIMSEVERNTADSRRLWPRIFGYAASVAAVILIGIILLPGESANEGSLPQLVENGSVLVTNTQKDAMEVNLPDGSYIRLSPGSSLGYEPCFYHECDRTVILEGEAYFDVVSDPERPFSVNAGGLITRVLGTSFTVRSDASDVSVTVKSGKVMVSKSAKPTEEPLLLLPNQRALYLTDQHSIIKSIAEAPVVLNPEVFTGDFTFDDVPVGRVFSVLEKAYGIPVKFDAERLKECYVTLPFQQEPFFRMLDVICRTIGATYEVADDHIRILSAGCV